MSEMQFEFGDRVRHAMRPEWGIGSIVKAEREQKNGDAAQRLTIRFPGAGVKVISTSHARLERVVGEDDDNHQQRDDHAVEIKKVWERMDHAEWLGAVNQRRVEEVMLSLPEESCDPFIGLEARLTHTAALYRFDSSGRGLIDWAVAQTGLDDPMTRFNRHELEQYYERWSREREAQLRKLLAEAGADDAMIQRVRAKAPSEAAELMRRRVVVR
jgi:hypothetical protein